MRKFIREFREMFKGFLYLIKPFWQYGKPYMLLVILPAITLNPIVSVIDVQFTKYFINSILENSLLKIVLTVVLFQGISQLCFIVDEAVSLRFVPLSFQKTSKKINLSIFQKAIKTDFRYFDDPKFYDEYTWTLSQYVSKGDQCVDLFRNFFANLFTIGALIALLSQSGIFITLVTVAYVVISTVLNTKLADIGYKKREEWTPVERKRQYIHKLFYERQWASDVKITNLPGILFRYYDAVYDDKLRITLKHNRKMVVYTVIIKVLLLMETCAVLLFLGWQAHLGVMDAATVMALFTASISLRRASNTFFGVYKQMKENSLYAKKIRAFFEADSTIENSVPDESDSFENPPGENEKFKVSVENVTFGYTPDRIILRNLSLEIHPGEKIAIVGENGVGKTTLIKLLLRLYDPLEGRISVNDLPIREWPIQALRSRIGVVSQDCNLYALTLRDNLCLYDRPDDRALMDLLKKFDLGLDLSDRAVLDRYMTKEFDLGGAVLSGGQRQKLAISRIFTKRFGLLILDEPSAALDPNAEYELTKLIYDRANTTTTILISHRLSTVKAADRIYVIGREGEIVESGSHDELMTLKGQYYDMFVKQSENYRI